MVANLGAIGDSRQATGTRMPLANAAAAFKERQLKQYLLRRCMNTNDRWIRYREVLMRTKLNIYSRSDFMSRPLPFYAHIKLYAVTVK